PRCRTHRSTSAVRAWSAGPVRRVRQRTGPVPRTSPPARFRSGTTIGAGATPVRTGPGQGRGCLADRSGQQRPTGRCLPRTGPGWQGRRSGAAPLSPQRPEGGAAWPRGVFAPQRPPLVDTPVPVRVVVGGHVPVEGLAQLPDRPRLHGVLERHLTL